jgi:hypothetical protein
MEEKVSLKQAVASAIDEFYFEDSDVPGCCSATTLHDLPCNDEITDAISRVMADAEVTKVAATRAVNTAIAGLAEQSSGDFLNLVFLESDQSAFKAILAANGWKEIGTYTGRSGVISIVASGLRRTRRG